MSRGLFTECFGLDRALAQRSMSSCPLTRHSDENVHPVADPALVEPLSECQNKPAEASARASATFTFYTYDGRAVTAAERFSGQQQSQTKTAWGVEYPPYSSHDTEQGWVGEERGADLAHSILRSRYPCHKQSIAPAYSRPVPAYGAEDLGGPLFWSPEWEERRPDSWAQPCGMQESKCDTLLQTHVRTHRYDMSAPWSDSDLAGTLDLDFARKPATGHTEMDLLANPLSLRRMPPLALRGGSSSNLLLQDSRLTGSANCSSVHGSDGQRRLVEPCAASHEHALMAGVALRGGAAGAPSGAGIADRASNAITEVSHRADLARARPSVNMAGEDPGRALLAPVEGPRPQVESSSYIYTADRTPRASGKAGGLRMTGMTPTPPIVGARHLMRVATWAVDGGAPLRIAILTWESLHTIAVGGVAPHVTELAAALERRGHEVHVYSRTGDGQVMSRRRERVRVCVRLCVCACACLRSFVRLTFTHARTPTPTHACLKG